MTVSSGAFWRTIMDEGEGLKLANLVTLSRGLLIVPIFALLLAGQPIAALVVYVLAASTDLVDGWLARREGRSSDYGAQLDAIVDNVFSLAILGFLLLAYPGLVQRHSLALIVLFGGPIAYLAVSWLLKAPIFDVSFLVGQGRRRSAVLPVAADGRDRIGGVVDRRRRSCGPKPVGADRLHPARRPGPERFTRLRPAPARPGGTAMITIPPAIQWGAGSAQARGPVVAGLDAGSARNAIGMHAGGYGVYSALAVATGQLPEHHRPDLRDTQPSAEIGPFPSWFDPAKIVTFDPWGHRVAADFAKQRRAGLDIRPTIAVTDGQLRMGEIDEALRQGRLRADGRILTAEGGIRVTKIAIEPVWWLPGVAARLGLAETDLRETLFRCTDGMYPALVDDPSRQVFLPPIGGTSVYLFGACLAARRPDDPHHLPRARRMQRLGRVRLRHLHLPPPI